MPTPHVLDLSHHDESPDFEALKKAGVLGVILKSTEGVRYVDSTFSARSQAARDAELRVGAYHFLHGGNLRQQIAHFMAISGADVFHALDWERNPNGETATLSEAAEFTHALRERLAVWPIVYGSDLLVAAYEGGRFRGLPLWVARYGGKKPTIPYRLWQFQSGETGRQKIAGAVYDASEYVGSACECAAWLDTLR